MNKENSEYQAPEALMLLGTSCHYLALSHSYRAKVYIQPLLQDESADVREIARESLHELESE